MDQLGRLPLRVFLIDKYAFQKEMHWVGTYFPFPSQWCGCAVIVTCDWRQHAFSLPPLAGGNQGADSIHVHL
jgi:hypothetical protein